MTVRELIEMLKKRPQNSLVILSRDSEGNGFSPVADEYSLGLFNEEYGGEFYSDSLEDFEEVNYTGVPAIVLWPTG